MPDPATSPSARVLARQKLTLIALSSVLLLAGFVVLFFLKRLPLPMRLVTAFGDFVAASALLLLLRQKFSGR
jgi:hypothetical protein